MQYITNLLDEGDLCGLSIFAMIVIAVGECMIQQHRQMRLWGWRIAAGAFILFAVQRLLESESPTSFDLVAAAIRGIAAGALVLGPSWISLACVSFLFAQYGKVPSHLRHPMKRVRSEVHDSRQDEEHVRQERERANRETVERRRMGDDRKRRSDARAKALRAFHLLRSDLGDRFTNKEFTEYVQAYLADHQTPEDVEHHATKLIQLLKQLTEGAGGGVDSYAALNQRLVQRKAAIATADIDDDLRDILNAESDEQYEEEFRRLIREKRQ